MKKVILILFLLGFCAGDSSGGEPKWQETSRGVVDVRTVLTDKENSRVIYIGTGKGAYKTEDGGSSWRSILSVRGSSQAINYLLFDAQDKKTIYAAGAAGLFVSANAGQNWSRIFKGKSSLESDSLTVAILPYGIYLGTRCGLFVSKDRGRSWRKESAKLGNSQIFNLAYSLSQPDYLYVACVDGVFKSADAGNSWERIFITHPVEDGFESEEEAEVRDEQKKYSEIRYVAIDPNSPDHLYLATDRGVYWSRDRGSSWESLPEYGLLSRNTQFLLFSDKSELYAVTKSGIFTRKNDGWRELSFNLSAGKVSALGLDQDGNLYACTNKGLFKSSPDTGIAVSESDIITEYSKGEPKIEDVQKQAVKYAEVDPQKIASWRKQAAKKALLPQVSVGIDRNTTDLWHWEGGSTTKSDDDTLRRGRDSVNWDVTLSWDLGELIWNDDQTSIDVRSRLMEEMRPLTVHGWSLL